MRCQLGAGIVYFGARCAFAFRNENSSPTMSRFDLEAAGDERAPAAAGRRVGGLAGARLQSPRQPEVGVEELEAETGARKSGSSDDRDQSDPAVPPELAVGDRLDSRVLLESDRLEHCLSSSPEARRLHRARARCVPCLP
jgi:hypothetical protein